MVIVKVRRDGNSSVVTIPERELRKVHLAIGDSVSVEVIEETGQVVLTPVTIQPRARHNMRDVAQGVIAEKQGLFERLAAYDRGDTSER